MMNHTLKSQFKVHPGAVISGKWHANQYIIVKELGSGANGVVYLARHKDTRVAIKMSENGMSITSEVNVLKSFAKVQGTTALGPSLFDVDDWQPVKGGPKLSFYAMEYIHGPNLLSFINEKGKAWITVLFSQLLSDLQILHENGWVFGDLKPENLIITGPPPKIRCIDVGGTTLQGRAIKEFTEFYDRGYWGLGSRKAEPTYDLFAVAMMMINTAYPKQFTRQAGGLGQLKEAVRQKPELRRYERVILKGLQGHYSKAEQMRADLLNVMEAKSASGNAPPPSPDKPGLKQGNRKKTQPTPAVSRQQYRKQKKKGGWLEFFMIAVVLSVLYGMYIFMKLL